MGERYDTDTIKIVRSYGANVIRPILAAKGMTLTELATLVGMDLSAISRISSPYITSHTKPDTAERIANALGLPIDQVFRDVRYTIKRKRRVYAQTLDEAYEQRVIRPQENPQESCWSWRGALNRGTPLFMFKKKPYQGVRYAWFKARGEWPPQGRQVFQDCGTERCTNPEHLRLSKTDSRGLWVDGKNRGNPKYAQGLQHAKRIRTIIIGDIAVRQCFMCDEVYDLAEYPIYRGRRQTYCRVCQRGRAQMYRDKAKEAHAHE